MTRPVRSFCLIAIVALTICIITSSHAQTVKNDGFYGGEAGLTYSMLTGQKVIDGNGQSYGFYWDVFMPYWNSPFAHPAGGGSGVGFLLGGVVDYSLSDVFSIKGKLNLRTNVTSYTEDLPDQDVSGQRIPVEFSYTNSLTFVGIDALGRFALMTDN